jgi:hypothetical protein
MKITIPLSNQKTFSTVLKDVLKRQAKITKTKRRNHLRFHGNP